MSSREANLELLHRWKNDAKPIEATYDEFIPGCTGKRRHPTKDAALFAAKIMKDEDIGLYHCRHCNGWHTGHRQ